MDQTTLELIAGLCVRAGTLMEDRSVELVSVMPDDQAILASHIASIEQAGHDLTALAGAAKALHRLAISANATN